MTLPPPVSPTLPPAALYGPLVALRASLWADLVWAWWVVEAATAMAWELLTVRLRPVPLIRCVQCGAPIRARRPRCRSCAGS
jgi:hypothetical protein